MTMKSLEGFYSTLHTQHDPSMAFTEKADEAHMSPECYSAMMGVNYIADLIKREDDKNHVSVREKLLQLVHLPRQHFNLAAIKRGVELFHMPPL